MDLYTIELILSKVSEMWRNHPEICPHHYRFKWSEGEEEHYECELCGHEEIRKKVYK